MNSKAVFELYERLYFHEVEAKEKIAARLQIPLAILLSIASLFAILIRGADFVNYSSWNILLFAILIVSAALYIASVYFFIRALYGHTYQLIPSAIDSEKYRQELVSMYKIFPNSDNLVEKYFSDYLFKYYAECSLHNTLINDKRSEFLHKCSTFFVINLVPLMLAFMIVTFTDVKGIGDDKNLTTSIDEAIKLQAPSIKTYRALQAPEMINSYTWEKRALSAPVNSDPQVPYAID